MWEFLFQKHQNFSHAWELHEQNKNTKQNRNTLQEAMNELMMSKEMEEAAQENLITAMQAQLLRDQNSQQEFFFQKPVWIKGLEASLRV